MIKKITSAILTGCMIMSGMAVGSFTTQAAEVSTDTVSATSADEIQQGQILQCWNWSYNNIKENMDKIASQGFSAIQTSPIQPSNMESNNNTVADRWWTFYQPTNFKINTESRNGLGTKADFMSMCEAAHEKGIKVVVDAVLNHMASQTTNDVCLLVPSAIRNDSDYWHSFDNDVTNYNDRKNVTQYCLYGLPDLNTQNSKVQNSAISYLKECIDAGADGFRFDAAKHIETPLDSNAFKSDYWPNVISAVTDYAQSTRSITPYYYGEVLGNVDNGNINGYTSYMNVTDDARSNTIRAAVGSANGSGAADSSIAKNINPTKVLQWDESHDDYINNLTSSVSTKVLNQTWAMIGSRAQVCGMYFARPKNTSTTKIGDADETGWANEEVKAVNDFKNYFVGQSEYLAYSGSIAYNERGTSGVVIANCNGSEASVNLTAHKMAAGTYYDKITGNKFTVANGQISGNVGPTGIAVVYKGNEPTTTATTGTTSTVSQPITQTTTQPATGSTSSNSIYFVPSTNWKEANARFAAYVWTGSTNVWVSLTDTDGDGVYSADLGKTAYTNVIFARMNPATTANNWNNKWNQTADLTIPADKNCFTVNAGEWNDANGTWSKYMPVTEPVETTAATTQVVTTTQKVTTATTATTVTTVVPTTTQKVTEPTETTVATTAPTTAPVSSNMLYFVPSTNWKEANARFAAYVWTGTTNAWVSLADTDGDGKYSADLGKTAYTNVIFARMNPATTDNNWNNKWNQTADLTIPTDKNCFTVNNGEWNNANGTWSNVALPTQPTTAPVTVPTTTTQPTTVAPTTQPTTAPVDVPTDGYYVMGNNFKVKLAASGSDKMVGTIALQKGTYTFKLDNYGTMLGYNKTITDSSNGLSFKASYSSSVTLNATGGTYTFQVSKTTNTLVVKYNATLPNAYLTGDLNAILSPVAGKTLAIGSVYLEAGSYQFKMSIGNVAYGYNKTVDDTTNGSSLSFKSTYGSSVTLNATGGTYTFTLNTATNRLTIGYVAAKDEALDDVHVSGDVNVVLDDNNGVNNVATGTVTLEEGTYSFQVYNYGVAYTAGVKINDAGTKQLSSAYKSNVTLIAAGGDYTFSFNKTTGKLVVEKA